MPWPSPHNLDKKHGGPFDNHFAVHCLGLGSGLQKFGLTQDQELSALLPKNSREGLFGLIDDNSFTDQIAPIAHGAPPGATSGGSFAQCPDDCGR
jgi:hypothetical protein